MTQQEWAVDAAAATAAELAALAKTPERVASSGLYSGLGGVAFALAQHAASTDLAQRVVDEMIRRGPATTDCVDIISGMAGEGLTLLWAAAHLERPDAIPGAVVLGDRLLAAAEAADGGLSWRVQPDYPRLMPNFSHGTAGVAFFLARLGAQTGEERFLAAAEAGASHLMAIASPVGEGRLIAHHIPDGESLHYLGWCHGPPGTVRLFQELHTGTADPRWAAARDSLVEGLLATGIPEERPEGFWNNVGRCCGDAGVAEFARDLQEWGVHDPRLTELERRCAENVLRRAEVDDLPDSVGAYWAHAEHRTRPEQVEAATGLMQGASGIGAWLLRAATADATGAASAWRLRLPDDL